MNRHERRKAAAGSISNDTYRAGLELADRMAKGLPPRNEQEAKEMEEAKALLALCDAFMAAPEGPAGDQIRRDAAGAASARIFGKQN